MRLFLATCVLLVGTTLASAQLTFTGSVGTAQLVPDPFFTGASDGTILLGGLYCGGASPTLGLGVSGLPGGYNTGPLVTNETIFVAVDLAPNMPAWLRR